MSLLNYFKIYYRRAGYKIFVIFGLILFGGALEVVGVSMLAPILSTASDIGGTDQLTTKVNELFSFFGIEPTLTALLIFLVITLIVKGILSWLQLVYAAYVRIQIRKKLQKELILYYSKLNYDVHQNQTSGYVNNIIVQEVSRFLSSFIAFTKLPVSVTHASIYFSLAIIIDWQSTVALMGVGFITFIAIKPVVELSRTTSRSMTDEAGNLQSKIIEYIQNILYLRATENSVPLSRRLNKSIDHLGGYELRQGILDSIVKVMNEPIAIVFLAAIIYFNVVIEGKAMTDILILVFMLHRLLSRILLLQGEWQRFNANIGGLEKVEYALELFADHQEDNGDIEYTSFAKSMTFSKVNLSYSDVKILEDITVEIQKNSTIGVVGPSGAGKTSFFNLVTGLLAPTSGVIEFDGKDFKDVDKHTFRKTIGFVPQDPVILNDTLLNNINFWRLDPKQPETIDRIKSAMKDAGCENLVPKLHDFLGERGIRLSGGERQRLAIAREILMEPQFLILDEATSALDSQSEEIIQNSLNVLKEKTTVLLIAHRLSTVRNCDKIYVFNKGEIEDKGSFDELYNKEGAFFRSMCDKQGVRPLSRQSS